MLALLFLPLFLCLAPLHRFPLSPYSLTTNRQAVECRDEGGKLAYCHTQSETSERERDRVKHVNEEGRQATQQLAAHNHERRHKIDEGAWRRQGKARQQQQPTSSLPRVRKMQSNSIVDCRSNIHTQADTVTQQSSRRIRAEHGRRVSKREAGKQASARERETRRGKEREKRRKKRRKEYIWIKWSIHQMIECSLVSHTRTHTEHCVPVSLSVVCASH